MSDAESPPPPRLLRSEALPWIVLGLGLALSVLGGISVGLELRRQDAARFERLKERVFAEVNLRFQAAEQALYGARTVIEPTGELSHARWAVFVDSESRFFDRGVVGLGYVQRIKRAEADALERRMRADGMPDFTVERRSEHDEVYVVTHLEPL